MVIRSKLNMRQVLFLIFMISCCFQQLIVANIAGVSLKLFHIISLLFIFPMITEKRIVLPKKKLLLFFVIIVISIGIGLMTGFGFNSLIFNYIFGLYMLTIFINAGKNITYDRWIYLLQITGTVMMIVVWVKNIFEIDKIITFLKSPYGHPLVTTIWGGGCNLEATWIGLFGFSFNKSKPPSFVYNSFAILLSSVYASRAGLLINILWIAWVAWGYLKNVKISRLIIGTAVFFMLIYTGYSLGLFDYIIYRFVNIGSDAGSIGRFRMWKYAVDTIITYPMGVGIGNSIEGIGRISSLNYTENNLHNTFLQMFIDLGIIGGMYYLIMIAKFCFTHLKELCDNSLIAILFVYIAGTMLQFRGGEPNMFIFLGIYLTVSQNNSQPNKNKRYN